jgi:hypothetical protein
MAKTVNRLINDFWKIRASINGAGYYQKIYGSNIGQVKWFDQHPQPQEQNEWVFVRCNSDITNSLDALAKADRTKLENYFSSVIDQVSFGITDWNRLRKFLIDLYASHKSLITYSTQISDPHSLSNLDLDELFRSFGFPYSIQLKGIDDNPLEQKIQFFLDLVNLYKVKGTPQSLVDVLQYYGVAEVDIYEFFLKLKDQNSLFFEGKAVAGTSISPTIIQFPFSNITSGDPHWLYTEQQILQLNKNLNINLPSKVPYIGIQPLIDLEGDEVAILIRKVQDQYDYYQSTGDLPTADAEITYIKEVRSLLELYLSALYMFNKLFNIGVEPSSDRGYLCYDGTNTSSVDIITEFNLITQFPTSRADREIRLERYYDLFTRKIPTNFLVDKNSAGYWLNIIAPDIKSQLDSAGSSLDVLYSLFKDISVWVRNNIGLGFLNFGFILFGIQEFFKDLESVIDFFKPIRARLLLLESLRIKNRLFNSIVVEDQIEIDTSLIFHDFMTGDSSPCCGEDTTCINICENCGGTTKCSREVISPPAISTVWKGLWLDEIVYAVNDLVPDQYNNHYVCIKSHISSLTSKPLTGISWSTYWQKYSEMICVDTTSGASYYSRETFDCGSNYDYGAVVDKEINISVTEEVKDYLRCPGDGTAFIVSEILSGPDSIICDSTCCDSTSLIYYQSSGFRDFDEEGSFDCSHGFDLVFITSEFVSSVKCYLAQEGGGRILQESGDRIIVGCESPPQCSIPVASLPAGEYPEGTEITLTTTTLGASIAYTTDGSNPIPGESDDYTDPIPLS